MLTEPITLKSKSWSQNHTVPCFHLLFLESIKRDKLRKELASLQAKITCAFQDLQKAVLWKLFPHHEGLLENCLSIQESQKEVSFKLNH